MKGRRFLDTNVLIYTFDRSAPRKRKTATALVAEALRTGSGMISYQVVQEFLNVALRKFHPPMTVVECRGYSQRVLFPLCEVYPSPDLYSEALSIGQETGWTFYDSLIVASALAAKCDSVWSEDLQDGRVVRGLKIQNPFA